MSDHIFTVTFTDELRAVILMSIHLATAYAYSTEMEPLTLKELKRQTQQHLQDILSTSHQVPRR